MINEKNKTEIIDRYLNGTLDAATLAEVEQKVQEDAGFRNEVDAQKALIGQLQWEGREKLRGHLKTLHRRNFPEDVPGGIVKKDRDISSRKLWLAVAASVALLVVAFLLFFPDNQKRERHSIGKEMHMKVPLYVSGSDGLGFSGRSDIKATDSVNVSIISGTEYRHHYRFDDTLKLYISEFSTNEDLTVTYHRENNVYRLLWDGELYDIDRGFGRLDRLRKSMDPD